ncbi:LysR family transcriptional regulator [Virgisporangium aliadipatigenens]|uniref:LysR family transcriptional regulator n=1 Tax=Virgisporangium aliadipatigenens TaxID=741659 RepID=A0A8J3YQB8_9ACTN|nr:LysR family transcriptional regulator [Virgisporangium aliadipatigenens]GIJ48060.1 LysR family transcriptional regulator [Virgisporangium aliadipatigenens]
MLDTWSLRVLVEVAARGSFSAAAEALSMTQPAVSRQIGGLERRVGVRLFRRSPRGVSPTPAGEAALAHALEVLDGLRNMSARLAAFRDLETGSLRMSAFPSANTVLVPEAIRRFRGAHPGVEITLVRHDPAGPLPAIRAGAVDVALVTGWELYADPERARHHGDTTTVGLDDVELTPLLDEELLVALPAAHRLASRTRIRLTDLAGEAWIEGAFPDCLGPLTELTEALGAPPRVGFFCDDWNGKQALVSSGSGITLVPPLARTAVRRDIVLRPTEPALPPRRLYAVTAPPPHRGPAAEAMLGLLGELIAEYRR